LVITSDLEASILVDRVIAGIARRGIPLKIQLSPGSHVIEAMRAGYQSFREYVVVSPGKKTAVRVFFPNLRQDIPPPVQDIPPPVIVSPSPRLTGRELLAPDEKEEQGYGLYSYLLFQRRIRDLNSPTLKRYRAAIEAYLEIEHVSEILRFRERRDMNVTYLPVVVHSHPSDSTAMLKNYDYARSKHILAVARVRSGDGPFILGTRQPVSRSVSLPKEHLFHVLSTVPERAIGAWVRLFLQQASQEKFWERESRDEFLLRLRTEIAKGGDQIEDLSAAFASIVWRFSSR